MEAKQEEEGRGGMQEKKGNLAISFSFSPSYKTHTQRYINTDKHKQGGRMLVVLTWGLCAEHGLARSCDGEEEKEEREERGRGGRQRAQEKGREKRGEVDEQAATQRGSSKQHNAASRPSLPPRQPDAPAPLSAVALKALLHCAHTQAHSDSPATQK